MHITDKFCKHGDNTEILTCAFDSADELSYMQKWLSVS